MNDNEQDKEKEEKKERVVDEALDEAGTCCLIVALPIFALLLLPVALLIR